MRNTLKKSLIVVLALVMAFAFAACGKSEEETGVANPFTETDQQGVLDATGIEIAAPEGAEDVVYSYCSSDDETFAQVMFEYNDEEYTYRIKMVSETSMFGDQTIDEVPDINAILEDGTNEGVKLAGIYGDWDIAATTVVDYCDGLVAINSEEAGFIAWLDVVPGAMYSLSMSDDATQDALQSTAEACFVPMQGDAE